MSDSDSLEIKEMGGAKREVREEPGEGQSSENQPIKPSVASSSSIASSYFNNKVSIPEDEQVIYCFTIILFLDFKHGQIWSKWVSRGFLPFQFYTNFENQGSLGPF